MVFLDDYCDADPNHKIIRVNGITTFLFHVAQCIIFCLKICVKIILISNASLKSFYSRLGFTVIKDFVTSTTLKRLAADLIMRNENIRQNRNKLLPYSVYTPSHDELDFFMTIELTSIDIKMCSEI